MSGKTEKTAKPKKPKTEKTPEKGVAEGVGEIQKAMEEREIIHLMKEEIKPYWRNPRVNARTIPLLIKSIEKYGFNNPIAIDENNVIVAGHTRHKALMKMDYQGRVPCVILSGLSEESIREFRIVDNKVQESSSWDEELLMLELRELPGVEEMQDFFDEDLTDLFNETAGVTVSEVTDKDLDKAKQQMQGLGESNVKKVVITCPHCTKDFEMQK